jgi:hypothetical protein
VDGLALQRFVDGWGAIIERVAFADPLTVPETDETITIA